MSIFNGISLIPQVGHLEAGDNVRLCSDADKMKNWQEGHGGWNDGMVNVRHYFYNMWLFSKS